MAIDTQDKLYIACRDSVLIFDEYGQRFGQFAIDISPHNISVDPAGNIYLGQVLFLVEIMEAGVFNPQQEHLAGQYRVSSA